MPNLHRTTMYLPESLWQRATDIAHEENRERMKASENRPPVSSAAQVIVEAATGKRPPITE